MNTVRIMRNDNSDTDETKEEELARNIKECVIIYNRLAEEAARKNVFITINIIPVNNVKQNTKLGLAKIYKTFNI